MQTYAMSNIKFNQMKNHILKEQLFPFHICRKMIDLLPQVLVLMIHSHKKSMENRSENHLTLSMEKQVVMKLFRIFQIRMIIWSKPVRLQLRCSKYKM